MNRGVLQNSPLQQMMAGGNPSWWPNVNNFMRPPLLSSHHQQPFISPPPNNSNNDNNSGLQAQYTMNNMGVASSSWLDDHPTHHQEQHQQLPESWSQLLLGGVLMQESKKMDTNHWEEQIVLQQQQTPHHFPQYVDVKQESSVNSYNNNNNNVYSATRDQDFQLAAAKVTNWSHHQQLNNIPVSSPQSCVTSFSSSNNLMDFSPSISSDNLHSRNPNTLAPDHTSECNSTSIGGAAKKAKIQPSSTQSNNTPTLKVRKEKLGDRITALHQLVSPFGKTDTASVLLEANGYIRFLQSQIEALSIPYLNNGVGNKNQPHPMQGERKCIFPEDPGQLSNDNCLKRKRGPDQDSTYEDPKDLRSKGLCLVPISCTLNVGSENGADYWAPAIGGGFR